MNLLVGNLLDVSRIRAGKFEVDLEVRSLGQIISEACEALADQARQSEMEVTCDIGDPVVGLWDRTRMEQVLVNLVTNAIKYGKSPIVVRLRRTDDVAELVVTDAGAGIPADRQADIFDQFARASSRHRAHSMGLGLYIVRSIVSAHGGSIELRSEPGNVELRIRLPIRI